MKMVMSQNSMLKKELADLRKRVEDAEKAKVAGDFFILALHKKKAVREGTVIIRIVKAGAWVWNQPCSMLGSPLETMLRQLGRSRRVAQ